MENRLHPDTVLLHQLAITGDESAKAMYLERQNSRLQALVAELLISNERLRQCIWRLQRLQGDARFRLE